MIRTLFFFGVALAFSILTAATVHRVVAHAVSALQHLGR